MKKENEGGFSTILSPMATAGDEIKVETSMTGSEMSSVMCVCMYSTRPDDPVGRPLRPNIGQWFFRAAVERPGEEKRGYYTRSNIQTVTRRCDGQSRRNCRKRIAYHTYVLCSGCLECEGRKEREQTSTIFADDRRRRRWTVRKKCKHPYKRRMKQTRPYYIRYPRSNQKCK